MRRQVRPDAQSPKPAVLQHTEVHVGNPVDELLIASGTAIGMFDMVGMKAAFDALTHWGHENGDEQMLANAEYIRTNFLDKGRMGVQTGGLL